MEQFKIPDSIRMRIPLIKDEWIGLYRQMGDHPHAPRWNTECGDRLTSDDMIFVRQFADALRNRRESFTRRPPEWLLDWATELSGNTQWFRARLDSKVPADEWQDIGPMHRSDMQRHLELIVPGNADLSRLVVNPTSGTTGHPIKAPNHPRAVGCYDPLIQYALERHGIKEIFNHGNVAAIQVCSQKKTITYRTVHSYHNGAGFAKINLSPENWNSASSADIYINDMKPVILSGDPFSFIEYMRTGITYRPKAVLTTALELSAALRKEMEKYFNCPIVDMYSLNETGPVAYSCPDDSSKFHILPHDLYAEILSADGKQLEDGTAGNIALSGGRNPYLPLLRYITGDTASISRGTCSCGEKTPALSSLSGRPVVLYLTPSGKVINSIDISGIIREYPVYFFQFTQHRDYNCSLYISAGSDLTSSGVKELNARLELLFCGETGILIDRNFKAGDKKNIPFVSEII